MLASDPEAQAALLACHPHLADSYLATLLQERCYAAWNSDPPQSVQAAAALAVLAAHTDHPEVQALAAWACGIAALVQGQMEQAAADLDDAATQFLRLDNCHAAASVQVARLLALAMLSRYDEAIATGLQARASLLEYGDDLAAGKIELNLGNIYDRRDQYAEAGAFYQAAYQRFQLLDDQERLVQAENGLANVYSQQHQFRRAAQLYEQSLARAARLGLDVQQALIEGNLGNLALNQGRYDQALTYLERSRRRYAVLGMPHEACLAERELADAYLELNLIPEATAIYERVAPLFADLSMPFDQAWTLAHHGRACLLQGQFDQARALLTQARSLFAAEQNHVCEAMTVLLEAQRLYAMGDYAAACSAAAWAEQQLANGGPAAWRVFGQWLYGEATRLLHELARAQVLLNTALDAAQRYGIPQVAYRCYTSLGLLAAALYGSATARPLFEQAVELIEHLRAPLPAEEFRTAFFADKLIPYAELVRLCLADTTSDQASTALQYVERARSRALADMLGGALATLPQPQDTFEAELLARLTTLREELNWFYGQINRAFASEVPPDPAAIAAQQAATHERELAILEITRQIQQHGPPTGTPAWQLSQPTPLAIASLQRDLGADTALIEYFALDDELLAFVLTDTRLEVFRNLGQLAQIESAVSQLRFQTDALRYGSARLHHRLPQLTRRVQHYLGQLYQALIAPLTATLAGRRLVVVPHRALHYVPFAALYDGTRYLVEAYEVCCAPGASILQHCLHRPSGTSQQALLVGAADERAPQVRQEVMNLAPLFPAALTLLDEAATIAALHQYAPDADIVHLACHGQFRPDSPLFSSLRLDDGWLTVQEVYRLVLNCSLVTLSACETGVHAVAPGDEIIGLARGFFSAGAPSLVVSLWTVDDTTTASLMTHFYQRLRAGAPLAAALRGAQCALLREHPHPFFWAPFVLLGRW